MQPTYSKEAEAFREKVQAFLGEHLPENWKGIGALPTDEAYAFTNNAVSYTHLTLPTTPYV